MEVRFIRWCYSRSGAKVSISRRISAILPKIRKAIYTINAFEAEHRQLAKTKGAFPNENSLLKLLYQRLQHDQEKMDDAHPEQ